MCERFIPDEWFQSAEIEEECLATDRFHVLQTLERREYIASANLSEEHFGRARKQGASTRQHFVA